MNTEGKNFIYQVISDYETDRVSKVSEMKLKRIEVVTGLSDLGYVEINFLEPVLDEEKIVVKGTRYVLAQSHAGESEDDE